MAKYRVTPILKSAAGKRENQDRGCVINSVYGVVLLIADGAGGVAGGAGAATMAVEIVQQRTGYLAEPAGCANLLHEMDHMQSSQEASHRFGQCPSNRVFVHGLSRRQDASPCKRWASEICRGFADSESLRRTG